MVKYNQTQKANIINRTNEIKALQEQKAAHNEKVNFYTTYSMVPDYTPACIIKHRFLKPLFEDIYGIEINFFSYRPIDLNFYGCRCT